MQCRLRNANIKDAELILEWRNDVTSISHSRNTTMISLEEHLKWFQKKINDPDCSIFILTSGDDNVGMLRIEKKKDVGEISFIIAPLHRGHGFGKKIIELAEKSLVDGVKALIGFVKKDNFISQNCFQKNDYCCFDSMDCYCFIKVLH